MENEMKKFFSNLQAEQKSLPEDAAKLLHDHFWDLDNEAKVEPKVWLTIEEAENLNSAINHLFGLVKLNQVKLTYGEAIALRTFDDRVDRATSNFNQVVKKVIEQAEERDG